MISHINHGELGGERMISFKGGHFEKDILLTCVRWYVAYPLSYRQLEGKMQGRGVSVDYSTIHWWVLKYAPQFEAVFYRRKRPVWGSWRMDETYIKVSMDAGTKMRYKPFASPSWRPRRHVGDTPLLLSP